MKRNKVGGKCYVAKDLVMIFIYQLGYAILFNYLIKQ